MGARNSAIANNAAYMEKNLHDIEFDIKKDEVQFIRNGIETLVTNIIDDISDHSKGKIEKLLKELVADVESHSRLRNLNCILFREKTTGNRLIKVGSFYEETKNHFPDEFDFVFVIGMFEVINRCAVHYFNTGFRRRLNGGYGYDLLDVFSNFVFSKQYKFHCKTTICKLQFIGMNEEESGGPARKLVFLYENQSGHKRQIKVDLAPAIKIYDPFLTPQILAYTRICSIPKFNRFIAETGSYLIVNRGKVSFTETEKRFMSKVLSSHHRVVYKLVKHLINGNDRDEAFKEYCIVNGIINLDISSFTIKTTMIAHHFQCKCERQQNALNYIHVCARDILLDLEEHVERFQRRHILCDVEARNNNPYEQEQIYGHFIKSDVSSKSKMLRSFGTQYLYVLGKSLSPKPSSVWRYMYQNIDKSYSQYMLDKSEKFFW